MKDSSSGVLAPPPVLTSERLLVRPLTPGDLEDCGRLLTEIGWDVQGIAAREMAERRRTWLQWTIASYREFPRLQQPVYGERAVERRADGAMIGMVGLVPSFGPFAQLPSFGGRPGARYSPEVGLFWALRPSSQGQGLATEAARLFLDHIIGVLNLARVVATTERDNARSIAVMRRLGMRVEANPWPEPDWFQVVGVFQPVGAEPGPTYRPARDRVKDPKWG